MFTYKHPIRSGTSHYIPNVVPMYELPVNKRFDWITTPKAQTRTYVRLVVFIVLLRNTV